jgi:hypothetical protein
VACAGGQPVPSPSASEPPSQPAAAIGSPSGPIPGSLPNLELTPGEAFPGVTAREICASGYSGRARNVIREQYVQVYAAYGLPYPEPAGTYELDHLIPLELGGDNSNRNLWPEPAAPVPGFHQKDELENFLHAGVCRGGMALSEAQQEIAGDWVALFRRYLQP